MLFLWVVTPCKLVGRTTSSSSSPRELQISHTLFLSVIITWKFMIYLFRTCHFNMCSFSNIISHRNCLLLFVKHLAMRILTRKCRIRQQTDVLLVNTPCSHLNNFWATGVSSGLATRVTLTPVPRGRLAENIKRRWTCFLISFLYRSTWCLLFWVSNGKICTFDYNGSTFIWKLKISICKEIIFTVLILSLHLWAPFVILGTPFSLTTVFRAWKHFGSRRTDAMHTSYEPTK
jgi:hypothetical protein